MIVALLVNGNATNVEQMERIRNKSTSVWDWNKSKTEAYAENLFKFK